MSLTICDRCNTRLRKGGALLFSSPLAESSVRKYHLCYKCEAFAMSALGLGPRIKTQTGFQKWKRKFLQKLGERLSSNNALRTQT